MSAETFLDGRVTLHTGDCRDAVRKLADASIDSVVTDPPYALVSIVKRWGVANAPPKGPPAYQRHAAGFMGQRWDTGAVAFDAEFWRDVWRVAKPGAHIVAFGGERTYHRLATAIEDAGFEIRHQLAWAFGQGFPKNHDAGNGWGTALKPAWQPICLARKPLDGTVAETVLRHGTGALNIDGCRVASSAEDKAAMARIVGFNRRYPPGTTSTVLKGGADGSLHNRDRSDFDPGRGRWPATLLHDGSDEVVACFPDRPGGGNINVSGGDDRSVFGKALHNVAKPAMGDSGSAARFFYTAKADADDRLGSRHPTVKPVDLMQWLVRLITPPGGTVLDPFAGTGTTGEAAWREGMHAVLVEREDRFLADCQRRFQVAASPIARRAAATKQEPIDDLPLFATTSGA